MGRSFGHLLQRAGNGSIRSQKERIPSLHFEKVGHHTRPDLVQISTHTSRYQSAAVLLGRKDSGIELRHDRLGAGGAIVLLGDANVVGLP